jgi:DNA-binding transcriptional LysR family regulator
MEWKNVGGSSKPGRFKKAADALFISMPAVSMQIKQLEEQLGVALFQRTTRKVDLTAEGEQLMITARRAMAELESGLARLQQTVDIQQGHLSFGCVPTIASSRLPAILTEFAKKYPGVSVHVKELPQRELLDAFLAERCPVVCFEPDDFAMVRHWQRYRPGLAALPLLLQLHLAYRLGLLPVTLEPDLAAAADLMSYPVEELCFTSSSWGAASLKPSCR